MGELLTVNQVADFYQVKPATVRRWIREGRIDYVLVGPARVRRIERAVVERLCEKRSATQESA